MKSRGKRFISYFSLTSDLLPQSQAETDIRSGVSFKGSQLLVLIFAILVASLGLNVNSIPVIIGAMLISPLMGPIVGMGLAVGIQDFVLLKRSLKNILMAVVGSLLASTVFFLISPQFEGSSQLLARTSPTIYDVLIALFGGAAGIVSIGCKNKGQVMPGVAIATSLMPPLCTAGYGLATWQATFFFGALYLFLTNMIFIFVAAWIGIKLMGYKNVVYQNPKRYKKVRIIVYTVVAIMLALSAYLTVGMINRSMFVNKASAFVEQEMVFPNTQVLNHNEYIKNGKKYIDVTLIGAALPKDSLQLAMMNKLDSVGLGGTVLNIKQGFSLSAADVGEDKNFDRFYQLMQKEIAARQTTIDSLRNVINFNSAFSDESSRISPEVKVLFPTIRDIALSRMQLSTVDADTKDIRVDTVSMVFVNAPSGLTATERKRLTDFVELRLKQKSVVLHVNPAGFGWPSQQQQPSEKPSSRKIAGKQSGAKRTGAE